MKKINFIGMAALAFLLTLTTSCLDSNGGGGYDAAEYVTLEGFYPMYDVYGDSGIKYDVLNQDKLLLKNTSGGDFKYHRALMYFDYEDNDKEAKTRKVKVVAIEPLPESKVTMVVADSLLVEGTKEIDTEKYQPFTQEGGARYNRGYFTLSFNYIPVKDLSIDNFILAVDKVEGNSVNLRLINTKKRYSDGYVSNSYPIIMSFKLDPYEFRGNYPDINFSEDITFKLEVDILREGIKSFGDKPILVKLNQFGL